MIPARNSPTTPGVKVVLTFFSGGVLVGGMPICRFGLTWQPETSGQQCGDLHSRALEMPLITPNRPIRDMLQHGENGVVSNCDEQE